MSDERDGPVWKAQERAIQTWAESSVGLKRKAEGRA
jgi:hypothetical protein